MPAAVCLGSWADRHKDRLERRRARLSPVRRAVRKSELLMTSTTRRFRVRVEWDPTEGDWVAHAPTFDHLFAFGETREEALARMREAIVICLTSGMQKWSDVPKDYPDAYLVDVDVQV